MKIHLAIVENIFFSSLCLFLAVTQEYQISSSILPDILNRNFVQSRIEIQCDQFYSRWSRKMLMKILQLLTIKVGT
jgi:hypothetical protein